MFRQFGKWFIVFALVFAVGGHWAFLQTVAWIGMTVSYSQTDSLPKALAKTFDGQHPCKLCKLVKEGKNSQAKSETQLDLKKVDFLSENVSEFFFPIVTQNPPGSVTIFLSRGHAPPTPPPLSA